MVIQFGPFTLDNERRQLFRDGASLHLTPKAFDLLALLAAHAPRVVSKRELHEQLWPGTFVADATLTGVVKELRRALDDRSSAAPIIRTAHRVGYALAVPIERPAARNIVLHWLVLRGRRVALHDGEYVVGRDGASDVFLDDVSVSRRHARLIVEGDVVQLEDLGSKNGTTVGGERVRGQVPLRADERIAFGSVTALFRSSESGMSTETRSRARTRRPVP
ncbi:MAG TPA: FHA domain-containing protein [Vicinamibacterales bacterium]|nr:FHA domain-containing protein [Vicinamibacterales bacterium]